MVAEVILTPEALVTDLTGVWSLVGVRALVDEQVVRLGEVTSTEAADELLLRPETPASHSHNMIW